MTNRLNNIRDSLGLDAEIHDGPQRAALPKVTAWLKQGHDDPAIALAAAQVLFADGELTLPTVESAAKPLRDLLGDEWGSLAKSAQRLLALKVLVLAAADEATMTTGGFRAIGLAASPWFVLPQRQLRLRSHIDGWISACAAPEQPDADEEPWKADGLAKALPIIEDKTVLDALTALKTQMTAGGNALTPEIQQKLADTLQEQLTPLFAARRVVEASRAALKRWAPVIDRIARDAASTSDIVWWGQARYCTHRNMPFRHMATEEAKRWWGAFDLAKRAASTQSETCASFLVETLLALGVDAKPSKPLAEWLRELHETLTEEAEFTPDLSEEATECVERCAVGLPVTWLRAHREDPFDAKAIAEATLVDVDTPIASWQWTSWLLRECMLEQLLG